MADANENFGIMHEEHRRIFEELKTQHLNGRRASKKPRAIIVLGQPGSVSDGLMTAITQNFPDKNFVLIDERALRQQHPKYEQSARENDGVVLGQITSEVQDWEKSLTQSAMKGQLNLVVRASNCED